MLLSIVVFLVLFSSFSAAAAPPLRRDPIHIPVLRRKYKYRSSMSRRGQTQDSGITDHVRHMSGMVRPRFITHKDNNRNKIRATLQQSVLAPRKHCLECCCPPSHSTLPLSPQTFNLILDTGSSDLWFAGTNCASCTPAPPVFDTTKSSTFQSENKPVDLFYGSANASGTIAQDTVSMGSLTLPSQTLGATISTSFTHQFQVLQSGALFWETVMAALRVPRLCPQL
jgi:Eukaryotic aspartyl protease